MNSYWVLVTIVQARKILGNFTKISGDKLRDFIFMSFIINQFPGLKLWPDAFLPDGSLMESSRRLWRDISKIQPWFQQSFSM
jgi:hypothetical protein